MMRLLLLVAMLSVGVATHAAVGETDSLSQLSSAKARREARRAAYSAEIDDVVRSRNYIFRPITTYFKLNRNNSFPGTSM